MTLPESPRRVDINENIVVGTWDATKGEYVAGDWRSANGTKWTDGRGEPCEGTAFDTATIMLDGGPMNGVILV